MKDKDFKLLQEAYSIVSEGIFGNTFEEFMNNIKDRTLIFFDTETTGFKASLSHNQITQIAAIVAHLEGEDFGETYTDTLKIDTATQDKIQWEREKAEEIKREDEEMLARGETPPKRKKYTSIEDIFKMTNYDPSKAESSTMEGANRFFQWLSKFENPLIVAQNAKFDISFLNNMYKRSNIPKFKYQVMDFLQFNKIYLEPMLRNLARNGDEGAVDMINRLTKISTDKNGNEKKSFSVAQKQLGSAFEVSSKGAHEAIHDVEQMIELVKKVISYVKVNIGNIDRSSERRDFGFARKNWRIRGF
jgi:hypothetical protein